MAVGIMEVHLVNAKGLTDTDIIGRMDPYVLIQYGNQERKSKVSKGGGIKPVWNEKFSFKVEYPHPGGVGEGRNSDHKLIFKIMDKDTFSSDDFLGQATIYVKDLLAMGVVNGSAELYLCKYRVVHHDLTYRGEIKVGVTFTPTAQEGTDREIGGWKQSDY